MPENNRRSPARLLAPLALVAFVVALLLVVGGAATGDGDDGGSNAAPTAGSTATQTTTSAEEPKPPRKRMYVVKAGDNLDLIAEKTGIPRETLEELNPELDPFALDIGQKITLRE